jgi:hypothetical protein
MLSITSGLALSPTRLNAGSPGRAFVREKVRMVIPSRRGMRRKSLLMM